MMIQDFKSIESRVSGRQGSYKDLSPEALLTSEEDFRTIFSHIPEINVWIEPGSGHGLGPILFAGLHPHKSSIGIEFEKSRIESSEAAKLAIGISNVSFQHLDLLNCKIPEGDTYFFYFPTGIVLDRILFNLSEREDFIRIIAIESHGDLLDRLRKESWLSEIKQIPLKSQRHHPCAVVFEKSGEPLETTLHHVSFLKRFFLIQDQNDEEWFGESYGLEWSRGDFFDLQTPPRTIQERQVSKILKFEDIPQRFHPALRFRRLGPLRIETRDAVFEGNLRKIFVSPTFKVEISTGQQLEWSEVKKIFWENTLCFDTSLDYVYFPHAV